jgi:diacylglycerol kinase (ATP)
VHTAIIVNRHAGSMRRDPKLAERMRSLCGRQAALHVTKNAEELTEVVEQTAQNGTRTIGIVGGDGTASATLTAIWRAYGKRELPRIAFLRGGTMNTIATSVGISQHGPADLLRRALSALGKSDTPSERTRPAMVIGDRLGFLFGTGIWYGYIAESYAGGQPSRLTNATVLGRAMASAAIRGATFERMRQPRQLSVRFADGAWEPREYLTVAAATVAHAGFGFRPFHRAFESDERFQLLAIKGGPGEVLRDMPGMLLGRGLSAATAHDTVTSWAELRSSDGPFGYAVDGDVATAQESLRLELGPSFRFLRI